MISKPACPVCTTSEWELLGTRTYKRSQLDESPAYARRRFEVLFNVWLPTEEEFVSESLLCRRCGFVIYSPRPTHEELNAKYAHLVAAGGDPEARPGIDSEYNRLRVETLYKILSPHLSKQGNRLLDFGGGDGRLLQRFLDRGDTGFVVDYTPEMIPGVTKLGDTLEDIGETEPFDAIVSSHVMEHVAEPRTIIERLRQRLKPNGVLYVEVPMEIWRKPPLLAEPVTHVNFFTHASMSALLTESGFDVISCRTEGLTLPYQNDETRSCVVRGLARPSENAASLPLGGIGADLVRRLLNPGLATQVWWAMKHPMVLPHSLWNRIIHRDK